MHDADDDVAHMTMSYSLRQKLGAMVYDLPRFLWAMRPSSRHPWVLMRNRNERLSEPDLRLGTVDGVGCDWQWTSDLHLAKVFPPLGRRLMKRALRDWPIESRDEPATQKTPALPALCFIIGHRGKERLPHLLATLRSIAAQRDVPFECIVVEQSMSPEIRDQLPEWVRYIHTPLPYPEMPYSRAWAFNVGARVAFAEALVLHDNDMLAPVDYAKEIVGRLDDGYEVVNLKRFIFYLSEEDSARAVAVGAFAPEAAPNAVMQNALGGTVAVSRAAYVSIGGFDESFIGWGGEDNEFWQRAQTRRVWSYGYLPIIHLWHDAQTDKFNQTRATAELLERRTTISPEDRIAELSSRKFGRLARTEEGVPG
jgi:GT2 family glycosyltransferase